MVSAESNLKGGMDALLAAMVAHDHSGLPLAREVRYTENGQVLELGDGLWGTLTAAAGAAGRGTEGTTDARLPGYRVDLMDSAQSQAVFFGGTLETTTPGMLALRMKMLRGRIVEIEAVAVRTEVSGERGGTVTLFQPSLLARFDAAAFSQTESAFAGRPARAGAPPRAALAQIAAGYFDAIEGDSSDGALFATDCRRRDNGVQAACNPDAPPLDPAVPAYRPFALDCAEQIDTGFFKRVSRVRERRFLAIDESRGLVLALALLDQPGDIGEIDVPGIGRVSLPSGYRLEDIPTTQGSAQFYVKRYEPNFRVPMTELTVQLIRVEGGGIAQIESISRGAPFGMSSGWPE